MQIWLWQFSLKAAMNFHNSLFKLNSYISCFTDAIQNLIVRSQGLFNLVFPTRTRSSHPPMSANHRIKHSSRSSVFIHPNDEPAEPLDINTLNNVHVIEELIRHSVCTDTVVFANSYWTKNLAQHFSLELSEGRWIGAWQRPCLMSVLCLSTHERGLYYSIAFETKILARVILRLFSRLVIAVTRYINSLTTSKL